MQFSKIIACNAKRAFRLDETLIFAKPIRCDAQPDDPQIIVSPEAVGDLQQSAHVDHVNRKHHASSSEDSSYHENRRFV